MDLDLDLEKTYQVMIKDNYRQHAEENWDRLVETRDAPNDPDHYLKSKWETDEYCGTKYKVEWIDDETVGIVTPYNKTPISVPAEQFIRMLEELVFD